MHDNRRQPPVSMTPFFCRPMPVLCARQCLHRQKCRAHNCRIRRVLRCLFPCAAPRRFCHLPAVPVASDVPRWKPLSFPYESHSRKIPIRKVWKKYRSHSQIFHVSAYAFFPASGSCRCRSVPYHAAVRVANSHPLRAIAAESHEGAVPYHAGVVPRRALCAPRQLYPAHEKLLRNEPDRAVRVANSHSLPHVGPKWYAPASDSHRRSPRPGYAPPAF